MAAVLGEFKAGMGWLLVHPCCTVLHTVGVHCGVVQTDALCCRGCHIENLYSSLGLRNEGVHATPLQGAPVPPSFATGCHPRPQTCDSIAVSLSLSLHGLSYGITRLERRHCSTSLFCYQEASSL
jgi:hypothetical protein